uniref:Lactoylglutathione lyase n=1 Tax=Davidia involucrata TaxID=16924 RepID=A0A5B6Z7V2_DAVIN
MVRILPAAFASTSSSILYMSSLRPSLSSSFSPIKFSSSRLGVSLSSAYNPSRRLALFHLSSAIPQSQIFGAKASTLLRAEGKTIEASSAANMAQQSTVVAEENALEWAKNDKRRMLHVVYRVGDLDKTIKFYTECLGMKLLRKRDIPEERYANAFLGYGPEDSHFVVELTYNYGVDKYDIGTGFGHFGIAVDDVAKTVELVKAKGGKVTREPGPVKGGSTIIAFIEDADGYKFELLERDPTPEPLCQVMLRVGDLDRSINFYKKAFGMELLRKRDNPEYKYTIAMMGYGPEDKNAVLELTYNYGVTEYDKGNGYAQIAIGTDDVYKTAEAIKLFGGSITREPGPLPGINTKITACLDPDGWKSVFVDNVDFLKELE